MMLNIPSYYVRVDSMPEDPENSVLEYIRLCLKDRALLR